MFAITAARLIREFCKPLERISCTSFIHDITFGKGQISILGNNPNVFLFYKNNQIPVFCTDDSGRKLDAGIYLNKTLESYYPEDYKLLPLVIDMLSKKNIHLGMQYVGIVIREENCQHLYSLFFDLDEHSFLHWLLNNGDFLKNFLENYNLFAKDIILEAKANENRIILPNFENSHLFTNNLNILADRKIRLSVIHKISKITIHLSIQQSRCLILLFKGKSAKDIAIDMNISYRTVEHYLARIKMQLGCSSSKELIAVYGEQLSSRQVLQI